MLSNSNDFKKHTDTLIELFDVIQKLDDYKANQNSINLWIDLHPRSDL